MRRIIAFGAFTFSSTVFAALPTKAVLLNNGFYTGNSYRDLPETARMDLAGVVDGYLYAPMFGADSADMME